MTDDLTRSITAEISNHPVVASDGYTYERFTIQIWIVGHVYSLTNKSLCQKNNS